MLAHELLYHGAMKKQVRKLGLKGETIRALSDAKLAVGGLYSGLSCSQCSISTDPGSLKTDDACHYITCSCNQLCQRF